MTTENNTPNDESLEEPILVEAKPEAPAEEPAAEVSLLQSEQAVQHAEYSSPFSPVDPKEAEKHTTLTVFGVHTDEEEIESLAMKEQQVLLSSDPTEERIAEYVNMTASLWEAAAIQFPGHHFVKAINKETAEWLQRIPGDKGKKIGINNPRFEIADTDVLEGPNVVRYIRANTGLGNVTRVPLWSSGLVLTVDSFREYRLLDLHNVLVRQRLDLGTETRGASFSGDDVYTVNAILDFILDHVIDCNVINWNVQLIRKLMKPTDIGILMAGALAGIYPSGYPLFHQCIYNFKRDEETGMPLCDYAITAKKDAEEKAYLPDTMLDFKRVVWVDNSRLTPADRLHMSVVKPTHTVEQVQEYQLRVNYVEKYEKGIEIFSNPKIKILAKFKNSTVEEYTKSATEWCTRVIEMVDKTMAIDSGLSEDERLERRNTALNEYATTVNVLKQTHWVDYLVLADHNGTERKIIDAKTIDETLGSLVQEDGFTERFEELVQEFKEDVAFAFTGYPNFECPKCKRGQTDPNKKYPTLIPINMVSYFFILMVWRNRTLSATKRT